MLDPYNSKCYGGMDGSTYSMVGIGGGYYHVLYDKEGKISGMVRTDLDYICRLDEDRLLCAGKISNGTELLILDKSLETEKKETVKIAGMSGDDGELRAAVSEYNRGRHEYFIEFKDYGNIGIEGMMKDIMAGDAPDIYLLEGMDTDSLIAGGFLEIGLPQSHWF